MIRAKSLDVPANALAAVPVIIRHSDPSLLSLPSLSRKIFFDIKAGVSRLLISVIYGAGVLSLAMSSSAPTGSPLGGLGLCAFMGAPPPNGALQADASS